ncbi:MAG: hypothetical protein Homavirus48_2 [Homavirus sp.]|uniref:Uncharacterized protein n=1 Tax=Homavirus sp. TaxID=2487769 RepID=A0A3G5A5F0_9VIRU|nr:MAG: hypothetical protein Homavirus48_2 [Homavirus sp.]
MLSRLAGLFGSKSNSISNSVQKNIRIIDGDQVFDRIDGLLGQTKVNTGCMEYIFTLPAWKKMLANSTNSGSNSAANPYGHAGIRYKFGDEINAVMNVSGASNSPLVNFFQPDEYLFCDQPNRGATLGNEQGGVINRSFLSVRIDGVDRDTIVKLDNYYKQLDIDNRINGKCRYSMVFYMFTNWFRRLIGLGIRGNCAYWTSCGISNVGFLNGPSNWPLFLFFKVLFTQIGKNGWQNLNVIAYRSIKHNKEPKGAFLYPFYGIKYGYDSIKWNLDSIATVIVEPRLVESIEDVESTKQSTNESTNESTKQSTNESTNESTKQSTNESTKQSTSESDLDQYVIDITKHTNQKHINIVNTWLELQQRMKRLIK